MEKSNSSLSETLTSDECQTLINIVGQVSAPVASREAQILRELIAKLERMKEAAK